MMVEPLMFPSVHDADRMPGNGVQARQLEPHGSDGDRQLEALGESAGGSL